MRDGTQQMTPERETTCASPNGLATGGASRANREPKWLARVGGERGQAVTEFAMVVPLFALMAFVLILFGKALYAYIQLTHSANEAARLAAVNQPQSGTMCSFLNSEAALPKGVTLTISYPDSGSSTPRAVGEPVKVTASTGAGWVPFIGGTIGNITASATMRIEQDTTNNTTLGTSAPSSPCSP